MTENAWYLLYIAAMAAGALFFFSWSRNPKGVPKDEYLVAILIPIWSGLMYLTMMSGITVIERPGTDPLYLGRYLDWVVTTPLLLWALFSTAHFYRRFQRPLLAGLIGADVVMILSGLFADLAQDGWARWTFFIIGTVCFLIIIGITWGRLRTTAYEDSPELGRAYTKVAVFLTVAWTGYPVIFALSPSGVGAIGQGLTLALLVVLPIVSKVGFSIYDIYELRKLGSKRPGYMPYRGPGFTSP